MRKYKTNEIYFESKINSQRECFQTFESKMNFRQDEFIEDCLDQMEELCIEIHELIKASYITPTRMHQLFKCKGEKITEDEIRIIKRKLHLS